MAQEKKDSLPTNAVVTVVNDPNDARMSETTRRLVADLGRVPNATVEVIVIQKGRATKIGLAEDPPSFTAEQFKPAAPARRTTSRKAAAPAPEAIPVRGSRTVAAALRALIQKGLTDEQIWPQIKTEFPDLTDNKKSYIAGQRRVLERKQG